MKTLVVRVVDTFFRSLFQSCARCRTVVRRRGRASATTQQRREVQGAPPQWAAETDATASRETITQTRGDVGEQSRRERPARPARGHAASRRAVAVHTSMDKMNKRKLTEARCDVKLLDVSATHCAADPVASKRRFPRQRRRGPFGVEPPPPYLSPHPLS
ncbi:hypothetical protein EVAR_8797_1 [Eumeta japonica]|uniref:Uncharacterized protein n=1 Tax=Eumeta variegata TaxID=151549 RepID=A0A4C1TTW5_EUMVA|nr:hypothetical protein EVAR_8797_1 [Eumeta japonica]